MIKEYHVFISHSWAHISDLENLRYLLQQKGYFNVEFEEVTPDYPINSQNADYIKRRLKQKISKSNIVLGIAGMYASYSEWMQWELDTAIDLGINIVGVIPRGQERISSVVRGKAEEIVRWNTDSIVTAIRKHTK